MEPSAKSCISVALCTYNGERFLQKQLASIVEQNRLPDELVVCDDRSTDSTLSLLRTFAAEAPFPVRIVANEHNLGSTRNFEQAIRLCSGDLIALSDQDDIWHPDRLRRCEEVLKSRPAAGLVFTDAQVIDDQDQVATERLWSTFQFTGKTKARFLAGDQDLCLRTRFVTGATVMFRSVLRDCCFPVGKGWIHDEWLAAATPLFADVCALDEVLLSYRQHSRQQVGTGRKVQWPDRAKTVLRIIFNTGEADRAYWEFLQRGATLTTTFCKHFAGGDLTATGAARLHSYHAYEQYLSTRARLPRRRLARIAPILAYLPAYISYGEWFGLVKDFISSRS